MTRTSLLLALLACAACGAPTGEPAATAATESAAVARPERFEFGSEPTEQRIQAWDVDVRPDGVGLPPGRGTVAEGVRVYQARCSGCHGPTGVEGPNDVLVGRDPWEDFPGVRTVGSYWPYATTLFDYLVRAMPQDAPGSLSADETYAVIAWILYRNEIVAEDAVMDAATLPAVVMPAKDRFVADDRQGGAEVR